MHESLKHELESMFKDILVIDTEDNQLTVFAQRSQISVILQFLKDKGFDHLTLVSAVDWIEEKKFELVYILTRYLEEANKDRDKEKTYLIVKTRISREKPQLETITGIFPNAEPYEREIHELFGISFEGHPRLTPLFLEREYKIPPFRKDFDTRKYVEDVFDTIPIVEEKDK